VNANTLKAFLNTAFFVLISVLISPDGFGSITAKDSLLSTPQPTINGLESLFPDKLADQKPKFQPAPEWLPQPSSSESPARSASVSLVIQTAFTLSQARAPPKH
jgi:hypothetical protein